MNRRTGLLVNPRTAVLVVVLVVAVSLVVRGAFSQASPSSNRRAINLSDDSPNAPFSGAILSGNTLYISGRIGIDSKTGNAPANLDEEIKLLLDHVKDTLVEAGMTMDDLVYVQVACTDLSLYDKFNAAYRGYFTTKRATQNKGCEAGALASCGLCRDRAPLGPDDSEQIPFAYRSNAERLIAAKKRFDQDDVFSSATPLRVR